MSLSRWKAQRFALRLISCRHVHTFNPEFGLVRDGCPQLVGRKADVIALVLLQGVNRVTVSHECRFARALGHLQLRLSARVKGLSILCPSVTGAKKRSRKYVSENKMIRTRANFVP